MIPFGGVWTPWQRERLFLLSSLALPLLSCLALLIPISTCTNPCTTVAEHLWPFSRTISCTSVGQSAWWIALVPLNACANRQLWFGGGMFWGRQISLIVIYPWISHKLFSCVEHPHNIPYETDLLAFPEWIPMKTQQFLTFCKIFRIISKCWKVGNTNHKPSGT